MERRVRAWTVYSSGTFSSLNHGRELLNLIPGAKILEEEEECKKRLDESIQLVVQWHLLQHATKAPPVFATQDPTQNGSK